MPVNARTVTVPVSKTPRVMYGGPRRTVRIVIHATHALMLAAARRTTPVDWDDDTAGCCHPVGLDQVYSPATDSYRWRFDSPHPMAIIRMHAAAVTAEILVHELMHAAAVIYRRDVCRDIRLGTGESSLEREEILAHLLSELTARATVAFADRDLWTVPE
jgi:hypothetical protein